MAGVAQRPRASISTRQDKSSPLIRFTITIPTEPNQTSAYESKTGKQRQQQRGDDDDNTGDDEQAACHKLSVSINLNFLSRCAACGEMFTGRTTALPRKCTQYHECCVSQSESLKSPIAKLPSRARARAPIHQRRGGHLHINMFLKHTGPYVSSSSSSSRADFGWVVCAYVCL